MSYFQDFLYEFRKLKNEGWKAKVSYILTYYWIPIVVILVLLAVLISQVIHFATKKEVALSGHWINAVFEQADSEKFLADATAELGIDSNTCKIAFSNSLLTDGDKHSEVATHQLIAAKIASQSLDFLVADTQFLVQYAYDESFCDLRTVLSTQQIQSLSPYFLYVDQSLIGSAVTTNTLPSQFPDPTAPEKMKKPVPFAIQIPKGSAFDQVYYGHTKKPAAIAILCNAPNMDATGQFIGLLFK
jgi:hypothetical protein